MPTSPKADECLKIAKRDGVFRGADTVADCTITPRDIVLIMGMRGSGKSTQTARMVEGMRRAELDHVIVDPYGEHLDKCQHFGSVKALARMPQMSSSGHLSFGVSMVGLDNDQMATVIEAASLLLAARFQRTQRACVLIVEEIYFTARNARTFWERIATQSRHYGMGLLITTQYVAMCPPTLRYQATRELIFKAREPLDIDRHAQKIGEIYAQSLAALGIGEFLEIT